MNLTPASYQAVVPPTAPLTPSSTAHVIKVKAALLRGAQDALDSQGFTQVVSPLLADLSGACGEPSTLIPVQVRGEQAFLRQTAQLYLEPLMRELGKVYSVSRSFRAERRPSERHLTEFTLVEGEAAGWCLDDVMSSMEKLAVGMVERAIASSRPALEALDVDITRLERIRAPFACMTYDEAIIALQRAGHFIEWGEDLTNRDELLLTNLAGGPLFVTHYPSELRFFTMKASRQDPRLVECCDLLMPGVGEVMGASETESDPEMLARKMAASKGVKQVVDLGGTAADLSWYIDMHTQSSGRQAGFGMGFERFVRYVCRLQSVAEAAA